MKGATFQNAALLSDSLLALADSYGVFAHVTIYEMDEHSYRWQNGYFVKRHTQGTQTLYLMVRMKDGQMGVATSTDLTSSGTERAFHQALRSASVQPGLAAAIQRMQQLETRLYPPLPDPDERRTVWPDNSLLQVVEAKHRRFATSTPILSTLSYSEHRQYAARSDGHIRQSSYRRLLTEHHTFFDQRPYTIKTGFTSVAPFPLGMAAELAAETDELWWLSRQSQYHTMSSIRPISSPDLIAHGEERFLLLDYQIMGELLLHCMDLEEHLQPPFSLANLLYHPLEGSPGFCPIHPSGYELAAAPLYHPSGTDLSFLQVWRLFPECSGHFALSVPETVCPTDVYRAESACQTLTACYPSPFPQILVLEGVEQSIVDPATGQFHVRPVSSYQYDQSGFAPLQPEWLCLPLAAVISGICLGIGKHRMHWKDVGSLRVVSSPSYLLVQLSNRWKVGLVP